MNYIDFLNLPENQRDHLVKIWEKQKRIRTCREDIELGRERLKTREINNQNACDHTFAEKTYKAFENEFGNYTGTGEYQYRCGDCGKQWSEAK